METKVSDIDVSAVVLSFNSFKYIEKCIKSLFDAFKKCDLKGEVIVVDNGSKDGSAEVLKRLQKEFSIYLKVIFQELNTGTTRSRNRAIKQARGNYILILDSDAYMNPEALKNLILYHENNLKVGLVAPGLVYPDGRFQLSVDVFPTLIRKIKRYYSLRSLEENSKCRPAGDVDYAISACWLLKKNVIKTVGLLDEKIFYSPEDVDYCIRIWKSGYEIHYLPQICVVHDAQEISRPKGFFINKFTVRHAKGLIYLFVKHRYIFSVEGLYRKISRTTL